VGRGDDPAPVAGCDLVVIAVPDAAIAATAAAVAPFVDPGALVVHLSGATGLEVLDAVRPPARRGALHPLQTLAGADDRALVHGAWFAVDGDPAVERLVASVGGRAFRVRDRALYHAAVCVASNHLVALFGQVERLTARAGVPDEALWPLVERALANVRTRGAAGALTGPVARGDAPTVARHLSVIGPDEWPTYVALAREALRLTGRHDRDLEAVLSGEPG
jgi:predicted short-subunit dehydrogenase-like oxidoreductase (DUF2520 family)